MGKRFCFKGFKTFLSNKNLNFLIYTKAKNDLVLILCEYKFYFSDFLAIPKRRKRNHGTDFAETRN